MVGYVPSDRGNNNNFRPISLVYTISKFCEQIVTLKLTNPKLSNGRIHPQCIYTNPVGSKLNSYFQIRY